MGCYTTILTSKIEGEGEKKREIQIELQIYTGYDRCMEYRIGDKIEWHPDPYWPGSSIDGVHSAHGIRPVTMGGEWAFVVIKDQTVVAVVEKDGDEFQCNKLIVDYEITPPSEDLWTDEQWARIAKQASRSENEDKILLAKLYGTPAEEVAYKRSVLYSTRFLKGKLKEESFLKKILPSIEVKDEIDAGRTDQP